MKNSLLLCLLMLSCSVGCKRKEQKSNLNVPSETISFYSLKETTFKNLPENFTTSRKYINLEIVKDKSYGNVINKLSVVNDRIYALDKRRKTLAVFNINGEFIGGITRVKKEFVNIADFDVDDQGIIYIVDGKLDNILSYSPDFKLLSKGQLPYEVDIVQRINKGDFLFGLSSWNKGPSAGEKILSADKSLKILNHIAYYDEFVDDNFWISDYRFLKTDKGIFYNKPIDNYVYQFSLDGKPEKKYLFDFGKMNVPDPDKKDVQKNLLKFEKYRLLIDFTAVNDKFALGKIWDKKQPEFFYVDRINKVVYLEDLSSPNELKHAVFYNGDKLISFIYPGEYDKEAFKNLPEESKNHLQNGGTVVCSYQMQ